MSVGPVVVFGVNEAATIYAQAHEFTSSHCASTKSLVHSYETASVTCDVTVYRYDDNIELDQAETGSIRAEIVLDQRKDRVGRIAYTTAQKTIDYLRRRGLPFCNGRKRYLGVLLDCNYRLQNGRSIEIWRDKIYLCGAVREVTPTLSLAFPPDTRSHFITKCCLGILRIFNDEHVSEWMQSIERLYLEVTAGLYEVETQGGDLKKRCRELEFAPRPLVMSIIDGESDKEWSHRAVVEMVQLINSFFEKGSFHLQTPKGILVAFELRYSVSIVYAEKPFPLTDEFVAAVSLHEEGSCGSYGPARPVRSEECGRR